MHDVYWLEEQGIPVAYVDTPGRVHKVSKDGDTFVMEYLTLKYIVRDILRAGAEKKPALIRKQFERQGIYRALRLAGAQPGDTVRLLDQEFTLDELPEPGKQWAPSAEGIREYEYIQTSAIGRLDAEEIKERARELAPRVVEALLR